MSATRTLVSLSHRFPGTLRPIAAAILALMGPGAHAATVTWTNPNTGTWDFAPNWSALPANGDTVLTGSHYTTYTQGTLSIASLTGTGQLDMSGGTLRIEGASSMRAVNLVGTGAVLSGAGTLAVTALNLYQGTLGESGHGGGAINVSGATGFDVSSGLSLNINTTLNLNGNASWAASSIGTIGINSGNYGGQLNIGAGTTFSDLGTLNSSQSRYLGTTSQGSIVNNGTYTRTGLGTTYVAAQLTNNGVVNVNGGGITLTGSYGGYGGGTWNVASGAVLAFSAGTSSSLYGTVNNNGSLVSVGNTSLSLGAYSGSGSITVNGGTFTTTSGSATMAPGSFYINGGTARLGSALNTSTLNLLGGGTLSGSGTTTTGTLSFGSGTMGESVTGAGGTTTVTGVAYIDGTAVQGVTGGRVLNLNGTTTWSAAATGAINIANAGSTVVVGSGATFADQGTTGGLTRFLGGNGNDGTFANQGTYNRTGLGTTQVGVTFNNNGVLNVNGGTMSIANGGSSSGQWNVASGATLNFTGGVSDVHGGTLNNVANGTISVTGGTVKVGGGGTSTGTIGVAANSTLLFNGGTYAVNGGTLTNAGTLTVSTGNLNVASSVNFSGAGTVAVTGGQLNSTAYANLAGGTMNVSGGTATFVNGGTIGTLSISGGTVAAQYVGSSTSLSVGTLNFTGGAMSDTQAVGLKTVVAGTATFGSGTETLSGGHQLTLNGSSTWAAGNGAKIAIVGGSGTQAQLNIGAGATFSDLGGGTRTLGGDGFSYVYNAGTYTRTGAGTTTATNSFTNAGTLNINGGTMAFASGNDAFFGHNSTGTINIASGATMQDDTKFTVGAGSVNNQGQMKVTGGTTTLAAGVAYGGAGAINVTGGALASGITGAITTGGIALTGGNASFAGAVNATSLALGGGTLTAASNVTVATDYTNAGFGSGNGFNKRAGVSGAGPINGTNVAEAITGANVTNGTTGNATLTIGNVRVGAANSYAYQVANTGTGSTLRGAIQTSGTGVGINDARLSGSGVTAANFGPLAAGANSGDLAVNFTATSAGALVLSGTNNVHVANNFGNVAEQNLAIVAGAGAAAYNAASGSASVSIGNARVGTTLSRGITVTNTAAAGAYSEDLNASIGATSGALGASGSVASLVAGGSNNSGLVASLDTSMAGAKSGSVTIAYATAGKVAGTSNGLGTANVGNQTLALTAGVYNTAVGAVAPTPIAIANQRVGGTGSSALTISNTGVAGAYTEALNASFAGTTGGATTFGGPVSNLAAGGSDGGSMRVGVGTATAGLQTGSVLIGFQSDGTGPNGNSGLAAIAAGSQTVAVSGKVFDTAVGSVASPITIANQRVGGANVGTVVVANNAVTGGYGEALNASFAGTTGGVTTNGGSIANLAAGGADGSSLRVAVSTSGAGLKSGSVTIGFQSDGTGPNGNSGLAAIAAGSQTVAVSGKVFDVAVGSVATTPIVIANQRIGGDGTSALLVSNTAATGGYSEALNANFAGTTGGAKTSGAGVSNLAAGASNGVALGVGVDTTTAGLKSGTVTVAFQSDGTGPNGNSGLAAIAAGSQNVDVSGAVYRLASPMLTTTSVAVVGRVGSVAQATSIGIVNSSPDIYTEGLTVTRGATAAGFTSTGSVTNLVAGGSSQAIGVTLDTSTAGTFGGTQVLGYVSTGTGTTGAADLAVGSGSVTLTGKVYASAVASAAAAIDFGIVHVGDAVSRGVAVTNAATGALADDLIGSAKSASTAFSATGDLGAGLAAGHGGGAMTVGLDTSKSGVYSGSAAFSLASHDADLSDVALADLAIGLSGTVDEYAHDAFVFGSGAGTLTRDGSTFYLDYGTVTQGSGARTTTLLAGNDASGQADLLDGSFEFLDAADFGEGGFAGFANLGAGQNGGPLSFSFDARTLGDFTDTITLHGLGHNASGYSGWLDDLRLVVRGAVVAADAVGSSDVPEPDPWMLLAAALPLVLVRRFRRPIATSRP